MTKYFEKKKKVKYNLFFIEGKSTVQSRLDFFILCDGKIYITTKVFFVFIKKPIKIKNEIIDMAKNVCTYPLAFRGSFRGYTGPTEKSSEVHLLY